ncbi:MAG: PAS domain S-box protein [Bacillus sp. (in: Bacteria)]|nr:PAS domain S-box protein [Bacillus sp. (in: firmicutes)]
MYSKPFSLGIIAIFFILASSLISFYEQHVVITILLLLSFFFIGMLIGKQSDTKKDKQSNGGTVDLEERTDLLYESLFNNNQDGILVVDVNGKVIDGNPAICKLSGYSLEEFKEIELASFVVEGDLERKFHHTYQALAGTSQEYSLTVKNRTGDHLQVLIKMVPIIVNEEVVGLFEIIKDITETKKMEEMMYHSDKLNAIGQLAAGVAHEIRNPLTSLKGFLQISKPHLKGDYVRIMEDELERINQIVGEFLFLSKPQKISFKTKNLTQIMDDVVQFIQPEALLTGVEIHKDYKLDVVPIFAMKIN